MKKIIAFVVSAALLFGVPLKVAFGSDTIPMPRRDSYAVGVDYHATGTVSEDSGFLRVYHDPEVRNLVKSQLQGMADAGIKIISTRTSFMDPPGTRDLRPQRNRHGFPPSEQELANIRQYAQDVADTRTPDGGYLDLYFSPFTHGCSNLIDLYNCGYTWEQRMAIYRETYTGFFNAIGDVKRSDGSPAVKMAYMNGEIRLAPSVTLIPFRPRLDEFIEEMWPFFIELAQSKNITPSLYYVVDHGSYYITQSNPDVHLNWIRQARNFLSANNLPIPERIDFSFYVDPINGEYAPTVNHIMQDIRTAFPGARVGITETFYPRDPVLRRKLGEAFAQSYLTFGIPEEILFWTTPLGDPVAPPFNISSYFLPNDVTWDGKINIFDYSKLAENYGRTGAPGFTPADINRDGGVNMADVNLFKEAYRR